MELDMKKLLDTAERKVDHETVSVNIFNEIIGKTFNKINIDFDADKFVLENEDCIFKLYHSQYCCESVYIESVDGDLEDLLHFPILEAESVTGVIESDEDWRESSQYTFFKFSTLKGSIVIRWYGCTNSWYSVNVDDYFELKNEEI